MFASTLLTTLLLSTLTSALPLLETRAGGPATTSDVPAGTFVETDATGYYPNRDWFSNHKSYEWYQAEDPDTAPDETKITELFERCKKDCYNWSSTNKCVAVYFATRFPTPANYYGSTDNHPSTACMLFNAPISLAGAGQFEKISEAEKNKQYTNAKLANEQSATTTTNAGGSKKKKQ